MKINKKQLSLLILLGLIAIGVSLIVNFLLKNYSKKQVSEPIEKIAEEKEELTKITAREATTIALSEAMKWQLDAEVLVIKNTGNVDFDGRGDYWLITVVSRSTAISDPSSNGYVKGKEYLIERKRPKVYNDSVKFQSDISPIPDNWLDSDKLLDLFFTHGMPTISKKQTGVCAMYLGKQAEGYEEYGKNVWDIALTVKESWTSRSIIDAANNALMATTFKEL